jgi:hypothetical protein
MTASTDTFVDSFVENAQSTREAVAGAVTEAVRSWAGAVAGLASGRPSVPDAHVVVDRWFDVAQTVLDTQKAFAKSVAGAGAHAAEVNTPPDGVHAGGPELCVLRCALPVNVGKSTGPGHVLGGGGRFLRLLGNPKELVRRCLVGHEDPQHRVDQELAPGQDQQDQHEQ